VVDAAISSAFEHYGAYCKAMGYSENVRGAKSLYARVELEFQEEVREMEVLDSIRDVDVIEHPVSGPSIAPIEADLSAIEFFQASKLEQEVREATGIKERPLPPHPDGHKADGDDGKSDKFGKAYTKVRKVKPTPAPVRFSYDRSIFQKAPEERDVEDVEVYLAFCGNYVPITVRSDVSQKEIETLGSDYFKCNLGLMDFQPPKPGNHYRLKAMVCQDRENAAWLDCRRSDTIDEEWVLFGLELSDADIIRVMEQRWFVPL
jgi:hypothetical protein